MRPVNPKTKERSVTQNNILEGRGKIIIVKRKDCSSAPQCEGEIKIPQIKLNVNYKNGFMGIDLCKKYESIMGFFFPLIRDSLRNITYEDYQIEACYNPSKDRWQISVKDNEIRIRAIKDLCLNNIYRGNNIVIENIDDIRNKITAETAWQAFYTFFHHLDYPGPVNYVIKEFIEKHEEAHMREFEDKIIPNSIYPEESIDTLYYYKNTYYKNYPNLVRSFNINCSDNNNVESVIATGKLFYKDINELLRKVIYRNYIKLKSDEFDINYSIRSIIKKYQDRIVELFPEIKNLDLFINYYVQEQEN